MQIDNLTSERSKLEDVLKDLKVELGELQQTRNSLAEHKVTRFNFYWHVPV